MAEGGSPAVAAAALNKSPAATPTMTVGQRAGRINQINKQISGIVGQMAREGANIPELKERKDLLEAEIDKMLNSPSRPSLPMAPRQADPPSMPGTVSAARGGGLSDLRDQMIAQQGFPVALDGFLVWVGKRTILYRPCFPITNLFSRRTLSRVLEEVVSILAPTECTP